MYLLRNSTQRSGIQLAMPWGGFQRVGVVFSWFSASAHRWTHTNKRVPPHPLQLPAHKHKVAFLLEWFLPLTAEALTGKSVNCLSYDLAYHKGSHLFSTYMTIFDSMHASTASPNKIFVCFFFFFFYFSDPRHRVVPIVWILVWTPETLFVFISSTNTSTGGRNRNYGSCRDITWVSPWGTKTMFVWVVFTGTLWLSWVV